MEVMDNGDEWQQNFVTEIDTESICDTVEGNKIRPRRIWSTNDEDKLFYIWGRDNWLLTRHGKNTIYFAQWSVELKELHNIDVSPTEVQAKINQTRSKFRQVKKGLIANPKMTRWKKYDLIDRILKNQHRPKDASPIPAQALENNRDFSPSEMIEHRNALATSSSNGLTQDETVLTQHQHDDTNGMLHGVITAASISEDVKLELDRDLLQEHHTITDADGSIYLALSTAAGDDNLTTTATHLPYTSALFVDEIKSEFVGANDAYTYQYEQPQVQPQHPLPQIDQTQNNHQQYTTDNTSDVAMQIQQYETQYEIQQQHYTQSEELSQQQHQLPQQQTQQQQLAYTQDDATNVIYDTSQNVAILNNPQNSQNQFIATTPANGYNNNHEIKSNNNLNNESHRIATSTITTMTTAAAAAAPAPVPAPVATTTNIKIENCIAMNNTSNTNSSNNNNNSIIANGKRSNIKILNSEVNVISAIVKTNSLPVTTQSTITNLPPPPPRKRRNTQHFTTITTKSPLLGVVKQEPTSRSSSSNTTTPKQSSNILIPGSMEALFIEELRKKNTILEQTKQLSEKRLQLEQKKVNLMEEYLPKIANLQAKIVAKMKNNNDDDNT